MIWKRRLPASALVAAAAALTLAGCGGGSSSPTSPSPNPSPNPSPGLQATFSSINSQVLQVRCISCHNAAGSATAAGLNLESAVAYANLVNTPSTEQATLLRVNPGNADASYLVHKLEGRAGIVGTRMPQGASPLTNDQIDVIKQWIQAGAQNN